MGHHEAFTLLTRLADNVEVRKVLPCVDRLFLDMLVNEYEAEEAAHDAHLDEMADAGVHILSDENHHKALVQAGQADVDERFSANSVVPLYEAYYDRVLAGESR